MDNEPTRRQVLAAATAGAVVAALPRAASALTVDQARTLVDRLVGEVNGIINSGGSEAAMFPRFEALFVKYADVAVIARSALGPAARSASPAQLSAFTKVFQGYISRKYGRRFREFIGGEITVTDARPVKSFFEVISVAKLRGESPFDVRWHVSDKSGRQLFFNIIIEGVNMLASERTEIGAMLDAQGGNVDALIAQMKTL